MYIYVYIYVHICCIDICMYIMSDTTPKHSKRHKPNFGGLLSMIILLTMPQK